MASKELGGKLRELRDSKGFTQQQVADELGLKNKSTFRFLGDRKVRAGRFYIFEIVQAVRR